MMRKPSLRYPVLFLLLAAAAVLCSCGDEGPDGPEPDTDCIGPAGGTIAETDTTSFLYGVSLSVAPGAWQQCWSVYLFYRSTFSTPNFPDGIEGYEGWLTGGVDLDIGRGVGSDWTEAPENLEFELTFPLRDLTAEPGEKIMAFRYDDTAGLYRLAVPMRLDDEQLTVQARHHRQLWTWGKVDLEEVDFDTYLAPVMEELHGEGGWLEIQAELDRLQAEALENRRALTCQAVQIARISLVAAGESAAENVRAIQDGMHGMCGTCDALTPQFYDELREYMKLQVGQYITEFFLGNSRNFLIRIYGFIMCGYMEYCLAQLDCDYACFADAVQLDFYVQLGLRWACAVVVELIDWAIVSGFIDCPV